VILQCKLVSGWRLKKRKSELPCRLCGFGKYS